MRPFRPPGETTGTVNSAAETEGIPAPAVEAQDYGGKNFNIYSINFNTNLYFTDGENGDVMNDAVWERKRLTEEYLNVNITYENNHTIQDFATDMKLAVSAGDDAYQLALPHVMQGISTCVLENTLTDWNTIEAVDFSREYWNQSIVDELSIKGHAYYVRSNYIIPGPLVLYFNKSMIADYNLENPYTLVRDGTWTLDKLISLASNISDDVNGDGKMNMEDRYGFSSMIDYQLTGFIYSSGLSVCESKDDTLNAVLHTEKAEKLFEKIYNLTYAPYSYHYLYGQDDLALAVTSGRVLFATGSVGSLMGYRESTVDIGVLPYPKYDEAQKDYKQYDLSSLMCMPASVADPEMAGTVTDVLSFYSMITTIPAYYDELLGSKLTRDEESVEMLDIIFNNIVYDAGMNYFGLDGSFGYYMVYALPQVCQQPKFAFESYFERNEKGFGKTIEDFMAVVADR